MVQGLTPFSRHLFGIHVRFARCVLASCFYQYFTKTLWPCSSNWVLQRNHGFGPWFFSYLFLCWISSTYTTAMRFVENKLGFTGKCCGSNLGEPSHFVTCRDDYSIPSCQEKIIRRLVQIGGPKPFLVLIHLYYIVTLWYNKHINMYIYIYTYINTSMHGMKSRL